MYGTAPSLPTTKIAEELLTTDPCQEFLFIVLGTENNKCVSVKSAYVKSKTNCKAKWNTHNVPEENATMEERLFLATYKIALWKLHHQNELIDVLKKTTLPANKCIHFLSWIRLILMFHFLCVKKKDLAQGKRVDGWKGSFKIGQQERRHMPKGAEVCWTPWIFIFAHQPFSIISD